MSAESLFNFLDAADKFLLTGFLALVLTTFCVAGLVLAVAIIGGILGWCGDKLRGI
jgi:hypothetical protein